MGSVAILLAMDTCSTRGGCLRRNENGWMTTFKKGSISAVAPACLCDAHTHLRPVSIAQQLRLLVLEPQPTQHTVRNTGGTRTGASQRERAGGAGAEEGGGRVHRRALLAPHQRKLRMRKVLRMRTLR